MLCGWGVKAGMACLQVKLCVAISECFRKCIWYLEVLYKCPALLTLLLLYFYHRPCVNGHFPGQPGLAGPSFSTCARRAALRVSSLGFFPSHRFFTVQRSFMPDNQQCWTTTAHKTLYFSHHIKRNLFKQQIFLAFAWVWLFSSTTLTLFAGGQQLSLHTVDDLRQIFFNEVAKLLRERWAYAKMAPKKTLN